MLAVLKQKRKGHQMCWNMAKSHLFFHYSLSFQLLSIRKRRDNNIYQIPYVYTVHCEKCMSLPIYLYVCEENLISTEKTTPFWHLTPTPSPFWLSHAISTAPPTVWLLVWNYHWAKVVSITQIHEKQIISCPRGPSHPSPLDIHHKKLLTQCDSETKTKGVVGGKKYSEKYNVFLHLAVAFSFLLLPLQNLMLLSRIVL